MNSSEVSWLSRTHVPYLIGRGEPEFSTCLDLEKPYVFVWDVNGYYAALGIPTDATRLQIREAYQRLEGWNSDRLTYIVKQLLDSETRRKYDAAPLGSVLVDYWVSSAMRRALAQKNISMMGDGLLSYEAIYGGDGCDVEDVVDKDPWSGQDGAELRLARMRKEGPGWSYYLWATIWNAPEVADVLDWWRNILAVEIGTRKRNLRLAVGLFGDPDFQEQWKIHRVGSRTVAFLGDHPMEILLSDDVPLVWKLDFLKRVARGCTDELLETI